MVKESTSRWGRRTVDEPQREHIREDLQGVLKGELLFDDVTRILYSTDASIFQAQPLGVVTPRDEEDVQTLVRYAGEHHLPLVPRGAGSGFAGESLGSGLIVDLSRHFRSIVEVGADTVRVQPGVVYQTLSRELARVHRRFAPDPASAAQCTIGGMVATNASGARLLRHGYTRDHVVALRGVLDTGDAVAISRHAREPNLDQPGGHLDDIVVAVAELLDQNAPLIQECRPQTPFNRCGYLLDGVLSPEAVHLARLLVGSEGTLAVFTEATLKTIPLPGGRGVALLSFTNLETALRAAQAAVATGPAACELLDHRLLTLARGGNEAVATYVPPGAEVVLLVEYEAASIKEAHDQVAFLADRLHRTEALAQHAGTAVEPTEVDRIWGIRASAIASLYRLKGQAHPLPLIEDVGVPLEQLPVYLHRVQDILQRHETTASFLIHAGTGQVHTRPFLDLERPGDVTKLWAIADEVHSLALDLGGTISTQHGTGLARTPWVGRQYGRLYPVLRELKAIFDPTGLFNPGKIVGPEPEKLTWRLRGKLKAPESTLPPEEPTQGMPVPANGLVTASTAALRWQPGECRHEVVSCNGCGSCRTQSPGQRMCPLFRVTHREEATPRAKANLLRSLLDEEPNAPPLSSDDVRAVADLCVNCKMCALECPAHVNVPKLMLEAKAANVAEYGLDRSDWVLARTESFAAFGSAFAVLVNAALRSRVIRWLMEKFFGLSRKRRLPTFANRSFLRRAERRGWTKPPHSGRPRVAYFVDVFANYNDPQLGEAVVAVLHHHGFDVYVPPGQLGCGMAPLAQGDVETAREVAQSNLRILAELARESYPILCSEPTAALMLQQDYLNLVEGEDVQLVADRTVELTTFLWELHQQGRLRTDFQPLPLTVGHHVPCHLKALGKPPVGPKLLALIPDLRIHTIDVSCSGMAGTFGLKAENYARSLEAGQPMLQELAQPRIRYGSTECSTCRLQMEDGGGKRTLHPVQYLALAYGLMPGLSQRLNEPIGELVLR
jgi:FAD/FMN-containing dehydrogenase/Fe-S oxidoreductase